MKRFTQDLTAHKVQYMDLKIGPPNPSPLLFPVSPGVYKLNFLWQIGEGDAQREGVSKGQWAIAHLS